MSGSRETKQTYNQSYDTVLRVAHLIFKLPVCCLKDCITCAAVCLSQAHAKMSAFFARDGLVPDKVLPANGAKLDSGGAVVPLHERLWKLTRASVALTSLALLVSSINTETRKAYDTFYEWLFSTNKYPHPASAAMLC